jgi:hypothetical protein
MLFTNNVLMVYFLSIINILGYLKR